jgi:hypothetical protein
MRLGSVAEQARSGFAAEAIMVVIVRADAEFVEGQLVLENLVDGFDAGKGLGAAGHVGLIGDDDQKEAKVFQDSDGFFDPGENSRFANAGGRVRDAIADEGLVEDAVPV